MMALICRITDSKKRYTSEVASILLDMEVSDVSSRSAMQQAVNGLYATAKLMAVFARLMNRNGTYSSGISSQLSTMTINDSSAKSAYQQMANGYYRLVHLAGLAADGINP